MCGPQMFSRSAAEGLRVEKLRNQVGEEQPPEQHRRVPEEIDAGGNAHTTTNLWSSQTPEADSLHAQASTGPKALLVI